MQVSFAPPKNLELFKNYASGFEAVLTYKISKKEVGIMINNAVAVNPKIFTSIVF